jgi:peptide deformylase
MSLSIVHYNDPVLHRKGEKITTFEPALARLAEQMIAAMHEAEGIGLGAPQVGRSLQLCVIDLLASDAEYGWELNGARPPRELFMPLVLVNPKVTVAPQTPQVVMEEGCLSFPKIRGDVSRPDEVAVEFSDERGNRHTLRCNGLLSRCVQHEVDHLNGVLFIDRMDKKARALVDADVKALAKRTRQARKALA